MMVPLSGKHGKGKFALVNRADFSIIKRHSWTVNKDGYAVSNITGPCKPSTVKCPCCETSIELEPVIKCRHLSMHRFVLGEPSGEIDHINRNKLDNRRSNLREVTRSMNCLNKGLQRNNTSGHAGVRYDKSKTSLKKWRAWIQVKGKIYNLGCFETKKEAVGARKAAFEKYAR